MNVRILARWETVVGKEVAVESGAVVEIYVDDAIGVVGGRALFMARKTMQNPEWMYVPTNRCAEALQASVAWDEAVGLMYVRL